MEVSINKQVNAYFINKKVYKSTLNNTEQIINCDIQVKYLEINSEKNYTFYKMHYFYPEASTLQRQIYVSCKEIITKRKCP